MNNLLNGSTHTLEIERLRGELQQYDEEFQRLKNQDITIRRLEDQLSDLRDHQNVKVCIVSSSIQVYLYYLVNACTPLLHRSRKK
jgi:hypothetical protein